MTFFILLGKEILNLKKSWGVVILLFLVPIFIILIMGYAFSEEETQYPLGIVCEDEKDGLSELLTESLSHAVSLSVSRFFQAADARKAMEKKEILGYLRVPEDFEASEKTGDAQIDFVVDNQSPIKAAALEGIVRGYLEKFNTRATSVHTAVTVGMRLDAQNNPEQLAGLANDYLDGLQRDLIGLNVLYATDDEQDTMTSFNQTTCGMTAMFILFLCILWGSDTFLEERLEGTMDRLLIAPIRFETVFLAKLTLIAFLSFLQFSVFFSIGHFFLDVPVGNVWLLILLNGIFILAAASIGLFISLIAKTRIASIGLSFFLIMIFSPLGGLWFPLSTVPKLLVRIAGFLPSGAYMLAIEKIIIQRQGFLSIAPNLLVIVLYFMLAGLTGVALTKNRIQNG